MAATTHRARVVWEGGREDLRAHRVEIGEHSIPGSTMPELGGDPAKADPEGLMVGALSSCHMLWFLDFARRARLRVTSYEDDAEATLDGERFSGAVLRPRVGWDGEPPGAAALAELHHRAHDACFIANSVSFPVQVELDG
jgi:organic hydroperoxide reductase OsmC/OhrA